MCFLTYAPPLCVNFRAVAHIHQTKPELTFLCFLPTDTEPHNPIFVAKSLVSFDAICRNRAGGTPQLLYVFDVCDSSRKTAYKNSHLFSKLSRSFFEILWFFSHAYCLALGILEFGF